MRNFTYARAEQLPAVVAGAGHNSTSLIAGGTELLNWMRLGIAAPERVLDIGNAEMLRGIRRDGETLVIGALATLNEVGESSLVREVAPALAAACLKAASAQIRNRATLGGNVLQKTRCPYFRTEAPVPWPCNKRVPGSGCAALHGHHERHAIFGWTEACVAVQPSDPVVALACLDATAHIMHRTGERQLAMTEFHVTPDDVASGKALRGRQRGPTPEAVIETRLGRGEVIRAIAVPISALSRRSAYVKVRERESYEYAFVSAAAALGIEDGIVRGARVSLGSVAMKAWRLPDAEAALVGHPFTTERTQEALRRAMAAARPLAENRIKITVATNAALRALRLAAEVA